MAQEALQLLLGDIQQTVHRLDDRVDGMGKILERNTASLEYHIKRTDQLERYVQAVEKRVKPLERSRERVLGAFKLFSVVTTVVGGIFALVRLWKFH